MMRLQNIPRPNKKRLLIFAGIVLGAVLLVAGGWWYNASRATNNYHSQVNNYLGTSKKELADVSSQFKVLANQGDTKKSAETLGKLSDLLNKQANNLPDQPQLFGITLTPPQDAHNRDERVRRLKQLAKDATDAKTLLTYQDAAALILQEVTTKTGPNADQQKALADAWQTMVGKCKALQPPAEAASLHQQIITAASAVQTSLAALPDLFNKKDVNGFNAKIKEVEAHISELRGIGDSIQVLNKSHDKTIASDYQRLLDVLK